MGRDSEILLGLRRAQPGPLIGSIKCCARLGCLGVPWQEGLEAGVCRAPCVCSQLGEEILLGGGRAGERR